LTKDGKLRHPVFLDLRDNKAANQCCLGVLARSHISENTAAHARTAKITFNIWPGKYQKHFSHVQLFAVVGKPTHQVCTSGRRHPSPDDERQL